jgi:lysyl-tRNA synthetase class 2
VLEVETPVLSRAGATDPNLDSFVTRYCGPGAADGAPLFLHTSPEFPMKRLLAAGSGPIYQVCRVFRNGESGRRHNPEFTLLEWYRPGFDHHRLMDEVETLLRTLLRDRVAPGAALRLSYAEAFQAHAGVDPHRATVAELARAAAVQGTPAPDAMPAHDRDPWLDLLLTQRVEPALAAHGLCFLYDYPASQAALARIRPGTPPVAERFEVYLHGTELANGFHELIDAREQEERFAGERQRRRDRGQDDVPADQHLLTALAKGLPPVAGVALGLDRLLMVLIGAGCIEEVIAFPIDRA